MKNSIAQETRPEPPHSPASAQRVEGREDGNARLVILLLISFLVGVGGAAYYFQNRVKSGSQAVDPHMRRALSEHTSKVLQDLNSPVEIHFYALLDPASVPASLKDFAGRVDSLLSEYAVASRGNIKIVRNLSQTDAAANAASADRIKPFNLDKGDACFLGLALSCQGRKESMPQLAPEWEQAIESDLTRAILRVATPAHIVTQPGDTSQPDAAEIGQVRNLLPNLASISVQEGTQILKEKAFNDFADITKEMQVRVQEAQQRLARARSGGSQSEQEAALQQFQKVQAEQNAKLKAISARLQNQIAALEYLKQK